MSKLKVFISSVQKEFAEERKQLSQFLKSDPLMSSFFEAVFFEELPASSQAPNKVYLDEVRKSQVYIVLLGQDYGFEDANGVSPTELEYECSKSNNIRGFAYIKGDNTLQRHEKEKAFIAKTQGELSYKRFHSIQGLIDAIKASLYVVLTDKGLVHSNSFDASFHPTAQLGDIDPAKIDNFLSLAVANRNFPIRQGSSVEKVLTHLHLFKDNKIGNSALLAFAKSPQEFFPSAITKCAHFHGYKVEKPIPDHKVFQGDIFQQIDQAVDFVLSKISVSVGVRDESVQAPIGYEIPRQVVTEAIVNAIAHRDYISYGSVQVMLFADRLEVFNPGRLVPELNVDKLKGEHASFPTNQKLAITMYQAAYIEGFGTGTGEIFTLTKEAGLKEPEFDFGEGVKVIIWRPTSSTDQATDYVTDQATDQVGELIKRLILVLSGEKNRQELMDYLDLKHVPSFRESYLNPALDLGYIELTIPDTPKSPNQKYRLTVKGKEIKLQLEQNKK